MSNPGYYFPLLWCLGQGCGEEGELFTFQYRLVHLKCPSVEKVKIRYFERTISNTTIRGCQEIGAERAERSSGAGDWSWGL